MKYEPLKNKKQKMEKDIKNSTDKNVNNLNDYYLGFKKGIDDSFNVFASYIEFYYKYKNNVKLLMNEQKEVWTKFVQYYEKQSDMNPSNYLTKYNNWLFDYIFLNINDKEAESFLSL